MGRYQNMRIFRAVTGEIVEKTMIFPDDLIPDGWHATKAEALAAHAAAEAERTEHDRKIGARVDAEYLTGVPKRRPGRPRKVTADGDQ